MRNITKTFPGVKALDKVNFEVKKGEVHALVGENGAGKSTLMKVLSGIHSPSEGEIIYQGKKVEFAGPLDAKAKGVVLIHQELSLVDEMTVAENIFLGDLPRNKFGFIDWKGLNKRSKELLERLECEFEPTELVGRLSIARQQMVEIARGLTQDVNIVVFDEPTASLTQEEEKVLFENINRLREQGTAIVYISHRLNEIFQISDRITVLRDGEMTGLLNTAETNECELTSLMIGRDLEDHLDFEKRGRDEIGKEVLKVEGLSKDGLFNDISFSIHEGEVLGLSGLVGAGRSELAETIFGVRKADSGKIFLEGDEIKVGDANKSVDLGIGFVPENRKEQGLILGRSVLDNLSLAKIRNLNRYGFIKGREEKLIYQDYQDKLDIKTPSSKQQVKNLSGGNQQKVIMAKWLCINPKLLILDEPTVGIDVGTKAEIHKLIRKLAAAGIAVLVISSEMPEVMGVSDRILTMYHGEITGEFYAEEATEEKLIKGITGIEAGACKVG
ncbi:sugar ABC transporter ATP-binding protein [Fuchsiella alkaliacetigena]|uniref:sugar ABC transporter ATP-binding protein n=1 Tax=Fuchsiella alkaliacetigena TaxID=957042 RepID=UPI0024A96389